MPSPKKETMKEKVYMCSGASDRYSEHSKREYYEPLMGVIIHVLWRVMRTHETAPQQVSIMSIMSPTRTHETDKIEGWL